MLTGAQRNPQSNLYEASQALREWRWFPASHCHGTEHGFTITALKRRESMEWHYQTTPRKKFRRQLTVCKIMASVLRDKERFFLVDLLEKCSTISSELYKETSNILRQRIRRSRPNRSMRHIFLLHDTSLRQPYTSLCTREAIAKMEWTVLPPSCWQPKSGTLRLPPVWPYKGWKMHYVDVILLMTTNWNRVFVMCFRVEAWNFATMVYNILLSVRRSVFQWKCSPIIAKDVWIIHVNFVIL
jgi:hypothetical protein